MFNRKKVVHMTTVHHPLDPRIYYKECTSLHRSGYDVTLIAPDSSDLKDEEVRISKLKKHSSRLKGMIFGTMNAYRKARKLKADVYHFHDPELIPVAWLLKKKNNVVIYDIHEDYETGIVQRDYLTPTLRKILAKVYKIIENRLTKNMELCLAEKYYKEKYPRGTCILNYPLLQTSLINHDTTSPRVNQLLYTGNLTTDRGALLHARLPSLDPDLSVHFYGRCSEHLAQQMKQKAGVGEERMHIDGVNRYLPKGEIDAAYSSRPWLAGVALFPPTDHYMKKELTKFFEYMTAGIPILCSDFPKWKEFIDTYQCGLSVDPYNDKEIVKALNYLRENPEEAKAMGRRGREAVLNHLNWQKEEEKLLKWYDSLIKKDT
ncbi:glycosyl transferase [Salipaludibacillus keqinensis]|uniref:Glycosyl transferase n=1 Tax=Salipaludibacillus keqinensis TaxID=2045207 RepID=A0A323TCL2_9BACI|nr:glycosyltransferase [Salipaludibacillus keqinensis]PYZ92540.1 glycosyl transferase [Salipaludibacillus keqinensis]